MLILFHILKEIFSPNCFIRKRDSGKKLRKYNLGKKQWGLFFVYFVKTVLFGQFYRPMVVSLSLTS